MPIIGILTQPAYCPESQHPFLNRSYLLASYVKYIESAGAEVVLIHHDIALSYLDQIVEKLDGILLPGGSAPLLMSDPLYKLTSVLVDKVIHMNEKGQSFPLLGICQGLEHLGMYISGSANILIPTSSNNMLLPSSFVAEARGNWFAVDLGVQQLETMESPCLHHSHQFAIGLHEWNELPDKKEFEVVAKSTDERGSEFVSIMSHKRHPIIGVMFHPERSAFESGVSLNISKERKTIVACSSIAASFVDAACARRNARESANATPKQTDVALDSICNYAPEFTSKNGEFPYLQAYFFPAQHHPLTLQEDRSPKTNLQ